MSSSKIRSIWACASTACVARSIPRLSTSSLQAVQTTFPKCCLQWEDFANFNAVPILERYRDKICTYNDDIQGTAAVALAGIFGALRISGQKLTDQRFLFLGAGSAATGIAELISQAMAMEGMSIAEARARNALFDVKGLIVKSRTDLADFQKPFALEGAPVSTFVEAVKQLKPTGIIGVSAVPKLFNQPVIEAMAKINQRPIIFPYSNPTSRSECTAEEAYRWSEGRAIFASGSPFPPVQLDGRTFVPGQGNNVYVFPAMGMAVFATEATRVTEEMFIVAAKAIAEQVTQASLDTGLIYPPQSKIFEASLACRPARGGVYFRQESRESAPAGRYCRAYPILCLPTCLRAAPRMTDPSAKKAAAEEAVHLSLQLGRLLLVSGADTTQVQTAVERFAAGLGCEAHLLVSYEALLLTVITGGEFRTKIGPHLAGTDRRHDGRRRAQPDHRRGSARPAGCRRGAASVSRLWRITGRRIPAGSWPPRSG